MINDDYTKEYYDLLRAGDYYKDFQEFLNKKDHSRAGYKGHPIPAKYQGLFYDHRHVEDFQKITRIMMQITNKITDEYLKNESYRKLFGFSKELEELILHDPGYDMAVPIGRYDLFYNGSPDYKFCELNTDGSSAMNEDNIIGKILLETKAMKDFSKEYQLTNVDLFDSWVLESIRIYEQIHHKKPVVAIVDNLDHAVLNEFELFKECYEKHGCVCVISDLRDLKLKGERLYHKDTAIDLIYRRFVTSDFMDLYEDCEDFITAYLNNYIMMQGSFRSHMMHNKLIFKIVRDPLTKKILTDEENQFIENHIPYTDFLTTDRIEKILKEKDQYIIKPTEGYASQGVYAGRDHTTEEFKAIIENCIPKHYIYQEYCMPKILPFVSFDSKHRPFLENYGVVIGLFIYGEKFIAPYTRIGRGNIISGAREYFVAPNILVQ